MRKIYALLGLLAALASAKTPANAILLSQVKTLTLRGDQQTTARRVKPIPQLKCVGGNAKGLYDVDVMRCKNSGSEYDAEDISWTCQANLPSEFKLGSTEVMCEGYASADDPYILKGSCGVEYRLALTELGEERYGKRGKTSRTRNVSSEDSNGSSTLSTIVFWAIFLGIVLLLAYKFFESVNPGVNRNRRPRRPFTGFGSGFPGGGDDNDPPPPYTRRSPPPPKKATSSSRESWRPGFWSGAATGAAAGYAMGSRNANRNVPDQAGPSNWFNTGARNTAPAPRSPPRSSWTSDQPGPSSSGSRYESTGFGGTTRR